MSVSEVYDCALHFLNKIDSLTNVHISSNKNFIVLRIMQNARSLNILCARVCPNVRNAKQKIFI